MNNNQEDHSPAGEILHILHHADVLMPFFEKEVLGGYKEKLDKTFVHHGDFRSVYSNQQVRSARALAELLKEIREDEVMIARPATDDEDRLQFAYKLRRTLVANMLAFKKVMPLTADNNIIEKIREMLISCDELAITGRAITKIYERMVGLLKQEHAYSRLAV